MSMLYNNIKIGINTNSDQLLETIWEHMKEVNKREVILLNFKFSSLLSLFLFLSHIFKVKLKLKFKIYFIIRVHSTNPKLFPWPQGSNTHMYVYMYIFILVKHFSTNVPPYFIILHVELIGA